MSKDELYELSKRCITINKGEEINLSWDNLTLTVRSEKGMHLIDFSHNLECLDKKIDVIETFISNSTNSPASKLLRANFVKKGMNNIEYNEMILNPAFWFHKYEMVQELASTSVYEWSPKDFLQHNQCALAVLNNIGNVDIYGQVRNKWINIFNLSQHVSVLIGIGLNMPENLNALTQEVYALHTTAICWSHILLKKNSCYLVTAQKNGDIIFWLLQSDYMKINCQLRGIIKSEALEISTMLYVKITEDNFLLLSSNVLGQIIAYKCEIDEEEVKCISNHILWHHKDRMNAKCMDYITIDDNIILICYKHRHLFLQMLDKDCNILSQNISNVTDYRITGIAKTSDGIFLSAINSKIYKVNIYITNGELNVTFDSINLKESLPDDELAGIGFSKNNLICALGINVRKVFWRKEPVTHHILLMTTERRLENAISILLNNSTKKLTDYWDCIELLRYNTMKTNTMPAIDYVQLYKDGQNDIYKLKIYLIFLTIYNLLNKTLMLGSDIILPENSMDSVKEKILLYQAKNVINKLNDHTNLDNFDKLDIESFYGAKRYIEHDCKKNQNVHDFRNIINILDKSAKPAYTCQGCDKELNGFSCEDGHVNMFCFISFTPIESYEYLVCKNCGLTARSELFPRKPMCLFCDLYLCFS